MTNNNDNHIDALILSAATNEWAKVAVLISKVFEAPDLSDDLKGMEDLAQKIAERIYILVDSGKLGVHGNMRRWRDGEVRLI